MADSDSNADPLLPIRMPDPRAFKFAHSFTRDIVPVLRQPTVPIFAANLAALDRVGDIYIASSAPIHGVATGTLFEHEDGFFIVTAEHVISEFTKPGRRLHIALGNPPRPQPISLADHLVCRDEQRDVAVIRLEPPTLARLFKPVFLRREHIALIDALDEAHYLLTGCLWEGSQHGADYSQFLLHNFNYWTTPCRERISQSDFHPNDYVLLKFELRGWSVRDGVVEDNPRSLGGMSGASAWRVFSAQEIEEEWSPDLVKVVAVQTSVYGGRIIRCTLWKHVLPLIEALVT